MFRQANTNTEVHKYKRGYVQAGKYKYKYKNTKKDKFRQADTNTQICPGMHTQIHKYVQAGKYTPESACEHPGAVRQLALEFARAGGDVTQTFTYGSTEGNLMTNRGFKA